MKDIKYWMQRLNDVFGIDVNTKNGHSVEEICDEDSDSLEVHVVTEHGGEGQGDEYYYVFKVRDKQTGEFVFIKFEGAYDSWNGVEWCYEPYLVAPKEKTIIVYEQI